MLNTYFEKIDALLTTIQEEEGDHLRMAAQKVAASVQNGGIIQMFGCGHSHILTEEVFYRAGGLVPIKPIFVEPLMLHEGAVRSSELERQNGYADEFLVEQHFSEEDVVFVLSTSGRNPVPVDVARHAKASGAFVIGVTSVEYSQSQSSRHTSGDHLYDAVDLVIDNHAPKGDAMLSHEDVSVPFAPSSTVTGAAILNAILADAIKTIAETGAEPPVFLSGNVDGADDHNKRLIEQYKDRISLLR
ncbi:SIS domain-containing protein [Tuberibacillus sp. Marseille-P3662]|uniref:SIS domain-containing protein n=1 Tax=Tuberibacillus sp. Marseille-P3662 TaxID=1965358 RepID=UPI000A1C7F6E|nr:SIS domain-containing protein [Tuberibacillus sp. Marseille-P3662]